MSPLVWVLNSSAFQANCGLLGAFFFFFFFGQGTTFATVVPSFFVSGTKERKSPALRKGLGSFFSEIILHCKSRPHLQGFSSCHSETLSPLSPLSSRQPSPLKLFPVLGKLEDMGNHGEKSSSLLSPSLSLSCSRSLSLSLIPSSPQTFNRPSLHSVCLCVVSLI